MHKTLFLIYTCLVLISFSGTAQEITPDSAWSRFLEGVEADRAGNFSQAIAIFQESLLYYEQLNDSNRIANCLNSLSIVNINLKRYEQARNHVDRAFNYLTARRDSMLWSNCLTSLGNILFFTGKSDSAQILYEESLTIKRKIADIERIPTLLGNLAGIGWQKGDMQMALKYDQEALELQKSQNNPRGEAEALNHLAYVYREMEEWEEAERLAQNALEIAQRINERNIKLKCLINLSTITSHQEKYKQAFDYQRAYIYLKDSLYNEENQRITSEMEARFDAESKEKDLAISKATVARQEADLRLRGLIIAAIAILSLMILGGIVFFYQKRRFRMNLQLQEEQREAQRLKELNHFKTRFFTNITHEFRTPLTVILGLSEEEKQDKNWSMVERNARHLLRLINQLLDLSKLETGKMPVQLIQTDVVQTVLYVVESFRSLAEMKEIELSFSDKNQSIITDIDVEKVQDILFNLLGNALKFTPEQGLVQVTVWQESGEWACAIQDNGPGISQHDQEWIFDRFARGESNIGGTGIGLALTRELLEILEGRITVESEVGKGSRFTFYLPVRHSAPIQTSVIQSENIPAIPDVKPHFPALIDEKPLILLIEDNADVVAYLQHCLEDQYRIAIAPDGEKGIKMALEQIPDAIVSDVMMPKKDGFEVCEILKTDEKTSHIPIILLTARAAIEDKLTGLRRGADAYLPKPFDREELLIRLEQLILLRKKLQARYQSTDTLPASNQEVVKIEDAFIKKVRDTIISHLHEEDFTVEKMADLLHLSRTQLYRKIKALTGRSISQFVNLIRVEQSKLLLVETDLTVSEIGYQVGFTDPAYFMRIFAKELGKSAGEWRKEWEKVPENGVKSAKCNISP